MTSVERILGGASILLGAFFLVYMIPTYTTAAPGLIDPQRFPSISAYMLIGFGLIQMITSKHEIELPTWHNLIRMFGLTAIVFGAIFVMPLIGYLAGAIVLMACVVAYMYERRWMWIFISVVIVPIGVWLFFEVLLNRPLPHLSF